MMAILLPSVKEDKDLWDIEDSMDGVLGISVFTEAALAAVERTATAAPGRDTRISKARLLPFVSLPHLKEYSSFHDSRVEVVEKLEETRDSSDVQGTIPNMTCSLFAHSLNLLLISWTIGRIS